MGTTTVAGSTLAISAGSPATQDAAGYAALTYTVIGGIEKIGTIGATFGKIEFQPLNGPKQKHKGPPDYGALQPSLAVDSADAGQTLLQTAAADTTSKLYAYKITTPDGTVRYSQGRVFGFPEMIDGASSMLMAQPTMELDVKPIRA